MARKAFNFFESYYTVALMLENDKDRLQYYDALMKKQFTNVDTELDGLAKFAYLSQKHSIEKQLNGYFSQSKDADFKEVDIYLALPTEAPTQGAMPAPTEAPTVVPSVQVQGKGQVQVQEKVKEQEKVNALIPEFSEFLIYAREKEKDINEASLKNKYDAWIENGWKNGYDKPIKSWKSSLLNTLQFIEKNNQKNNINGNSEKYQPKFSLEKALKTYASRTQ